MPAAEIKLGEMCPGCLDEGRPDNELKTRVGGFNTYCIGENGNQRHLYDDTGTLKLLLREAKAKRELAAKRDALKVETATAVMEPPPETPISVIEPRAFEVTEMDAARLSELLQVPITDSGTLVGVIWSAKNDANKALTEDTRQTAATSVPGLTEIRQRADGGLAVQIFMPWSGPQRTNVGYMLFDKANFNGISPTQFAQDLFENVASGNYFPPPDLPVYPEINPRAEGYWILITVPEMYVGAMLERAQTLEISAQYYLQNYFKWLVDNELFP